MGNQQHLLNRSLSIYIDPYYKCLIDIILRKEGFESRSDFISMLLQYVFVKEGLWDDVSKQPTKEALKRSPSIRRLKGMLDLLKKEEGRGEEEVIFDGLEKAYRNKKTRK